MNNNQNIKVSEALKKGKRWLNMPCVCFFLFFFMVVPAVLLYIFRNDKNSMFLAIGFVSSVLLGIIAPFLWWSINVVKYKIWAGNNVKDIHRFFEEAQSKNIISERAFLKRIEIKSSSQEKELLRFYNRLNSEKKIIKDINNDISKETIFKNGSKANIVVSILLIGGMFYLYESGEYNIKSVSIIGGVLMLFIGFDLYKRFKYNFVLKIDSKLISYKDDKTIIYWKDIISYNTIPGIQHNPSKLIINTKDENYELKLENYGTIKLGKIIDVLNENKHRFEINQSSSI